MADDPETTRLERLRCEARDLGVAEHRIRAGTVASLRRAISVARIVRRAER